jgi:hypothetical protein
MHLLSSEPFITFSPEKAQSQITPENVVFTHLITVVVGSIFVQSENE